MVIPFDNKSPKMCQSADAKLIDFASNYSLTNGRGHKVSSFALFQA
jgi:hypothetical protein